MNNAALLNMGRHSDHHRGGGRSYEELEWVPRSAHLPSGYAAALLTALFPRSGGGSWTRARGP